MRNTILGFITAAAVVWCSTGLAQVESDLVRVIVPGMAAQDFAVPEGPREGAILNFFVFPNNVGLPVGVRGVDFIEPGSVDDVSDTLSLNITAQQLALSFTSDIEIQVGQSLFPQIAENGALQDVTNILFPNANQRPFSVLVRSDVTVPEPSTVSLLCGIALVCGTLWIFRVR